MSVIDLKSVLYYDHSYNNLKGVVNEFRQNDFFSNHGLFAHERIAQMRKTIQRKLQSSKKPPFCRHLSNAGAKMKWVILITSCSCSTYNRPLVIKYTLCLQKSQIVSDAIETILEYFRLYPKKRYIMAFLSLLLSRYVSSQTNSSDNIFCIFYHCHMDKAHSGPLSVRY